jgi:nicotinamide mononucleotide transporter
LDIDPLELSATLVTLTCVILGVKRSLWQFPVGLIGTGLFFLVVWNRHIYANAALQVFFIGVQFYGWWYWMKGSAGHRPPIRNTPLPIWLGACVAAVLVAAALVPVLKTYTPTTTPMIDGLTFTLSVVAQFLLDRKRIETWIVWTVVNVASVILYATQGLWIFTALYVFFFFNAFWGWWEWRRAMKGSVASSSGSSVSSAS